MAQESELNGTVPTGRQTPFSDHSSISSVSSQMRRRKPSHSTIRHPRRRTKPFKLSLNLTVKVQPMDNGRKQRFSLNKSFGPDDDISDIKSSDSRSSLDSSKDKKKTSRDRRDESGFDSLLNKSRNSETSFDDDLPCRLNFDESLVEPREIDAVEAKSSNSRSSQASPRSSQDSLKNIKKMVQTTGNRRYKNKRSLLSFASLRKPQSKSLGTSVRFHGDLPHRFSSNGSNARDEVLGAESSDSHSSHASSRSSQGLIKDKRKVQTTGNHRYKNKRSSMKKPRSKSLTKIPGFVPYPRPQRLSFNDSTAVPDDEVIGNESMKSDADKTFPLDKSFPNSLGLDDSLPLPRRLSFNDSVATAVAPVEMSTVGSETPKIYYHQRLFRVGFIGNNGVQMAFNCVVNIRSDQEVLYVKPCELLFEGEKVWSRPVRQVTEEIQAKLAADKKNQI